MTQMPAHGALEWDVCDRLGKSLRVSGKSNAQLADDLGIHRNTVGNYLSGRTPIDRRTLIAWAVVTGVPFKWLETGVAPGPEGGDTIDTRNTHRYSSYLGAAPIRSDASCGTKYPEDLAA